MASTKIDKENTARPAASSTESDKQKTTAASGAAVSSTESDKQKTTAASGAPASSTKSDTARVEVSIPRGPERGDPNLFVGVNGVNYLLPRGRRSSVPAAVAAELARSEHARDRLDATMDALQRART